MAEYEATAQKDDTRVAERFPDVYSYVLQQETAFKVDSIPLGSTWNWNMWKHIDRSFLMKNSQFTKDNNTQEDTKKPYNNIIIPILNVAYRTEGFDVKDIELYVDDKDYYHMSLLGRKYHNKWAIENSIDTVIDESVESYADYGLALVKNVNEKKPELIKLKTKLAFCDQTDVLAGPICLKHEYSIDELIDMGGKWYQDKVDEAILYSKFSKRNTGSEGQEAKTPGKNIEVYELHGMFPESWIADKLGEDWQDTGKYCRQMHIITYYVSGDGKKNGLCLFKGKQKQLFKALKRDEVEGRACGRGGIEELFHAQIWTNFSEIHLMQMLEAVSKVLLKTTDKKLKNQKISNMKHGQIIDVDEGKILEQLVIQPFNKNAFDNFVNKWEQVARTIGSASDPALGLNPVSGTPLGTTEIVTNQGQGVHEYRRGKLATFWGEIYRDWVLNYLKDDMNRGEEWLDELNLDELQEVAEKISLKHSKKKI